MIFRRALASWSARVLGTKGVTVTGSYGGFKVRDDSMHSIDLAVGMVLL